jgi:hypothetical protein
MSLLSTFEGGSPESAILRLTTRLSTRQIGIRNSGVSWGRRFSEEHYFDGKSYHTLGKYEAVLAEQNYGIERPIYVMGWSLSMQLLPGQQDKPKLKGGPTKRQKRLFKDAWEELKKRLQNKGCVDALGGQEKVNQIIAGIESGEIPIGLNWNLGFGEDEFFGTVPGRSAEISGQRSEGKFSGQITLNPYGMFFLEGSSLTVGYDLYDFNTEAVESYFPVDSRIFLGERLRFGNDSMRGAFILLHELGHATGKFGSDLLSDGTPDISANESENSRILDACFSTTQETDVDGSRYISIQ